MELLINPNVAYLLIVTAVLLTLVAIIVPGTGGPEAVLLMCLLAAGFIVFQLGGINLLAVMVVGLSTVPFFFALRAKTWRIPFLVATILLLIGGSIFLFTGKNGLPLVDPILAALVSIVSGVLIWFGADRSAIAMQGEPVHNPNALIGKTGEARTDIQAEGSVQVDGELWSARSEKLIKKGKAVRILRRDGLILTVEQESE